MDVIWKKVPEARSVLGGVNFVDEIPRNVVWPFILSRISQYTYTCCCHLAILSIKIAVKAITFLLILVGRQNHAPPSP